MSTRIPGLHDAQAGRLLEALDNIIAHHNHSVKEGVVGAPTNASTQASGASGSMTLRVNHTALRAAVGGDDHELAAAADVALHNAAFAWGATSGKSVVFAVLFSTGSGDDTPAIADVAGTVADTGSQVAPTDAEITTALGHSNWVRIADLTVNRTADTTLTQSADNTVRPTLTGASRLALTNEDLRGATPLP